MSDRPTLAQFVDEQLVLAPAVAGKVTAGCLQLLGRGRESGYGPGERADQAEVARALAQGRDRFEAVFVETLAARARDRGEDALGAPRDAAASSMLGLADLELMDESRVEIDIELSRATQLVDSTAEWELRELQLHLATLVGREAAADVSHPFRPMAVAAALWEAAGAVVAGHAERALLLRTAAGVAAGLVKSACAAATASLERRGVQPGVYRTVVLPSGTAVPRPGGDPSRGRGLALASLLAGMPSGRPSALRTGEPAPAGGGVAPRGADLPRRRDLAAALDALQRLLEATDAPSPVADDTGDAGDAGAGDADVHAGRRLQARAALVGRADAADRAAVELVERLFDALVHDTELPPAVRPLLRRLEVPVLRAVLAEAAVLDDAGHPAWRLIDRIGELAVAQTAPDDPALLDAAAAAGDAVDELAALPSPGTAAFRRALERLERHLGERTQTLVWDAAESIEALKRAERRDLLEQHLTQRLVEQMVRVRTTPAIRRFVTGAWARVIAAAMLEHGEQSEAALDAFRTVDDLLWSLRIPDHRQSRQRLVALLPGLLQRVRAGMDRVGLAEAERQAVLDDLMAAHTEALRPGGASGGAGGTGGTGGSGTFSADEIVQRLREETDDAPLAPRRSFSESVIDLSQMETVPVDALPSSGGFGEPGQAARRVDDLRTGERFRVFYGGRWRRVQLLWKSDHGQFFHFSGDGTAQGRRGRAITRRALEKATGAGLVQPLEARPLMRRAIDRVGREAARAAAV